MLKLLKYAVICSLLLFSRCSILKNNTNIENQYIEEITFEDILILNPRLYSIFDTTIQYFKKLNCSNLDKTYFILKFFSDNEGITVRLFSRKYNDINLMVSKLNENPLHYGFYYKNLFFWIDSGFEIAEKNHFVTKKNESLKISYKFTSEKGVKRAINYDEFGVEYTYSNNEFIRNKIWECIHTLN